MDDDDLIFPFSQEVHCIKPEARARKKRRRLRAAPQITSDELQKERAGSWYMQTAVAKRNIKKWNPTKRGFYQTRMGKEWESSDKCVP